MADLLTEKQFAFVVAYAKSGNATHSAEVAGYESTGNALCVRGARLIKNPKVQAALRQYHREHRVTSELVISRLWEEAKREGTGSSHSARVQALGLLAKILGLLLDRSHVTADIRTNGGTSMEDLIKDPLARKALDQIAKAQERQAKLKANGNGEPPRLPAAEPA